MCCVPRRSLQRALHLREACIPARRRSLEAWYRLRATNLISRCEHDPENVLTWLKQSLVSILGAVRSLVGRDDLRGYRSSIVKRTPVIAIECVGVDGRVFSSLKVWPAATYRSNWTSHPLPGLHCGIFDKSNLRSFWNGSLACLVRKLKA